MTFIVVSLAHSHFYNCTRKPIHTDTPILRARTRRKDVSDHFQSLVTQIRTNCEHERAETPSAITVSHLWRKYALSVSTNAPKRRQRSLLVSGDANTHALRARTRRNDVHDHYRPLVTQICTNCKYDAPKRRQRLTSVSGDANTHFLQARTRKNDVSDHC